MAEIKGAGAKTKKASGAPGLPAAGQYHSEGYAYLRLLLARYCPDRLPRKAAKLFRSLWQFERAIVVYMMRVELEWTKNSMVEGLKSDRNLFPVFVANIHEIYDDLPFLEKIAEKVREYRRGLL